MLRRESWRYVPTLDTLESRWVPDGSVNAALKNGVLTLMGDVSANQISITGSASGNITVSSLDGTTKLNGGTADLTFQSVKGLSVNLGAGDNVLTFTNLNFQKDLSITTASGADKVTISNSTVGSVLLKTGAGNDTVTLDAVNAGGLLGSTNGGVDTLTIRNSTFSKQALIDTGADADAVTLTDSTFSKEFMINTGSGADTLMMNGVKMQKAALILTGSDNDKVTVLDTTFSKEVLLSAGSGNDQIVVSDSVFNKSALIDGWTGTDLLASEGNTFVKRMIPTSIESQSSSVAPMLKADSAVVGIGGSVVINVAANDTALIGTLDLTSVKIIQQPTHGTVTVNPDGTVKYTQDGSTMMTDSFSYTIMDSNGLVSQPTLVTLALV